VRGRCELITHHHPYRDRADGVGDLALLDQLEVVPGLWVRAGQHQGGALQGGSVGDAPTVGVKHRADGKKRGGFPHTDRPVQTQPQRVQDDAAVAVQDALRVAGGGRCVTQRRGGVLVELRPGTLTAAAGQQVLVGVNGAKPRLGHPVGHHHIGANLGQIVGQSFHQGNLVGFQQEHAVPAVVDDVADLLGEQPQIHRVQYRAQAWHREIGLVVPVGVPRHCAHAVTLTHTECRQGLTQLPNANRELRIRVAVQAVIGARDDLLVAEDMLRPPKQPVNQQLMVHHQSVHVCAPVTRRRAV
jgi:hypothetical protein